MIKRFNWKRVLPIVLVVMLVCSFNIIPTYADNSNSGILDIVFNSTGTHIDKDGNLKIRLDFYPTPESKSYGQQHIFNSETSQWQTNPSLCVFVTVSSDITKKQLEDYIAETYTPDVTATIDNAVIQSNLMHLISPYMRDKTKMANATKISSNRNQSGKSLIMSYTNSRLSSLSIKGQSGGNIQDIEPQSISIGDSEVSGNAALAQGYTAINLGNPANGTGYLSTFEIWFNANYGNATGVKIGTFYGSSTSYTSRDYESIGNVTAGSKQTFTGLNCDVTAGDFIGYISTTGKIAITLTGGSGVYYKLGNQFGTGIQTYTLLGLVYKLSLDGTGTETATAPTITISSATSVNSTTATLNGAISNLNGNASATVTAYWGTSDGGQTPASWAYNSTTLSPANPQGVNSFTCAITGLSPGTTYYFSAAAVGDVSGTGWPAASLTLLTIPAAPTFVGGQGATDGTYPDKVVITWTKSTGATNYKVLRGATNDSGTLGDVATYDDTAGSAPTITPGTASASDGTSTAYVTCTLSGQSASNGSTESYTVYAYNATGWSSASSADNGYKGTTTLTFQWQMSDADSDTNYNTNLIGGTTNPFNATQAPSDGSKRYFRSAVAMTGASTQYSTGNEGYRSFTITISNSPTTLAFGIIQPNSTNYAGGSIYSNPVTDGQCTFTITNNSAGTVKININETNPTGGVGWTLAGSVGLDTIKDTAVVSVTDPASGVVLTTSDQTLIASLAGSATKKWDLQRETGTFTDGAVKTSTITLTGVAP